MAFLISCSRAGDISITFTVPDGTETAYIAKVAAAKGWTVTVFDPVTRSQVANNEDKLSFIKRKLGEEIIALVTSAEVKSASEAAAATAKYASEERAKLILVK